MCISKMKIVRADMSVQYNKTSLKAGFTVICGIPAFFYIISFSVFLPLLLFRKSVLLRNNIERTKGTLRQINNKSDT